MVLFKATILLEEFKVIDNDTNHWNKYNVGNIKVHKIPANHETIIYPENSLKILKIIEEQFKTIND